MITQPTTEQIRRINSRKTYSGPGFGPRSFECLGIAVGIMGATAGSHAGAATLTSILAGVPLAWQFDVSAAGTGTSPTGNGNTLTSGTQLHVLKDQSGNGIDWATPVGDATYSAAGGPNGNAMISTAGVVYMRAPFVAPAPGTTPSAVYLIARIDAYNLNGALYGANGAQQIAGSSAGNYTARNTTPSTAVAVTAGTWIRAYVQFTNSTADILKMGSAAAATGINLGNTAGTTYNFLGVDAAFLSASYCFGFRTAGLLTSGQLSALDALYSGGRFAAVAF